MPIIPLPIVFGGKEIRCGWVERWFSALIDSMLKVLIVEDNATFRQSLKEILSKRFPSMVFLEAGDAREALERVDALLPSLILMDIGLPGENGLKLTKKIKTLYPQTIIIILTIHNSQEYRQAAYQHGANYFLSKGESSGEDVLALVESILSGMVH
jgi:DNA-binding NarL/FixJ family response regulator